MPKTILSSTATRAATTAKIMMEQFADKPEIQYISGLYNASPDTILTKLRSAPDGDVMVVGHNPGIAGLADFICETRPKHPRFTAYPTGATLIAEVRRDHWSEVTYRDARELFFLVPREITVPL